MNDKPETTPRPVPVAEREQKPPGNVTVGFLYRPHAVFDETQINNAMDELTRYFATVFTHGDKNILLLEQAINIRGRTETFQQAYERHKSFKKAQAITLSGITEIPNIDGFVDFLESNLFDNPGSSREQSHAAFYWIIYKVLDTLIAGKYDIQIIPEEGLNDPAEEIPDDISYENYIEALTRFAHRSLTRDKQIAQQTTGLVEEAEKQQGNTHVAGLFGPNHEFSSSLLPKRVALITTVYPPDDHLLAEAIRQHPRNQIIQLIKQGENVPESLWQDAYHLHTTNPSKDA